MRILIIYLFLFIATLLTGLSHSFGGGLPTDGIGDFEVYSVSGIIQKCDAYSDKDEVVYTGVCIDGKLFAVLGGDDVFINIARAFYGKAAQMSYRMPVHDEEERGCYFRVGRSKRSPLGCIIPESIKIEGLQNGEIYSRVLHSLPPLTSYEMRYDYSHHREHQCSRFPKSSHSTFIGNPYIPVWTKTLGIIQCILPCGGLKEADFSQLTSEMLAQFKNWKPGRGFPSVRNEAQIFGVEPVPYYLKFIELLQSCPNGVDEFAEKCLDRPMRCLSK